MKFNRLAATALASLSLMMPGAALADNSFDAHVSLADAIAEVGVDVYINPPEVCEEGIAGMYISGADALVVCQDNATGEEQVDWTANDLDTLRHEAQHLIQDCVAFRRGDQTLAPMLGSDEDVIKFAYAILGEERMDWIVETYTRNGASARTIILEFEAWAVGYGIDASDIEQALRHHCEVPAY